VCTPSVDLSKSVRFHSYNNNNQNNIFVNVKGSAVHKGQSQSGGGVSPVRTFFGQESSSDAEVSSFLLQKD